MRPRKNAIKVERGDKDRHDKTRHDATRQTIIISVVCVCVRVESN